MLNDIKDTSNRVSTGRCGSQRTVTSIVATLIIVCAFASVSADHFVPYFPAAENEELQGLVRIVNQSPRPGVVRISAIDDKGRRFDPIELVLDSRATVNLNSADLELGRVDGDLNDGIGDGEGDWRLELSSDVDTIVTPYVHVPDGFLTAMHAVSPIKENRHLVAYFNLDRDSNQESFLRLINFSDEMAEVTISGRDELGNETSQSVKTVIQANSVRHLTATQLVSGAPDFIGGYGTWQLSVHSTQPMAVMSLSRSSGGHVTNLSAIPTPVRESPDMIASPGTEVTLVSKAVLSCVASGASVRWGQLEGPAVSLRVGDDMPSFVIPDDTEDTLVFRAEATCGGQHVSDVVTLEVQPTRIERVLSPLIDFSDVDPADRPLSREDFAGLLVENDDSLATYVSAASRGLVSLEIDVLDWLTLSNQRTDYPLGSRDVIGDVVERLSEVVNLDTYDKVFPAIYPLEGGYPGCAAYLDPEEYVTANGTFRLGIAWLSGRGMSCVRKGRIAHEYGHTFGFGHALSIDCHTVTGIPVSTIDPTHEHSCRVGNACLNDDCSEVGEGRAGFLLNIDPDMLGNDSTDYYENYFPLIYHSVWQAHAGWLSDTQIVSTGGSHWISSLESLSSIPKVVTVPLGQDHGGATQAYWVEVRKPLPDYLDRQIDSCSLTVRLTLPNRYDDANSRLRGYGESVYTDTLRFVWQDDGTYAFRGISEDEPFWDPYRGVRFELVDCLDFNDEVATRVVVSRSNVRAEPPIAAVTASGEASVTVSNLGVSPVRIEEPYIGGRHASAFTLDATACNGTQLGLGKSCKIMIESTSTSDAIAFLRIPNDDDLAPDLTVSLVHRPM